MFRKLKFTSTGVAPIYGNYNPLSDTIFMNLKNGDEIFVTEEQYNSLLVYKQVNVAAAGGKPAYVKNEKGLPSSFQVIDADSVALATDGTLTFTVASGTAANQTGTIAGIIAPFDVAFNNTKASVVSQADGTFVARYTPATGEANGTVTVKFAILK